MSECMTQEDAMNMSDEQAVQILKPFRDMMIDQNGCPISDAVFALDKAIVALKREERKKGKWKELSVFDTEDIAQMQSAKCSACGKYHTTPYLYFSDNFNFCPNCGADMRTSE